MGSERIEHCILGIETSCDETAASVYTTSEGVLSNEVFSQIALHAPFGGVMPEVASRSHLETIRPIVQSALHAAHKTLDDITAVAVTFTPGLPGSLLVGVSFAKGLAWPTQKKLIGVNHLEGHIFSACIENDIPFPFICITASGGHTALYLVHDYGNYTLLGQTVDDAAGEAFDKIAKLLGLPYPGGPVIEKLAGEAGFQDYFNYPRPLPHSLNFSFSGLKTAVLYDLVRQGAYDLTHKLFLKADDIPFKQKVASSLLVCIADCFEQKLALAFKEHSVKAVAFVGGVACNRYIKKRLELFCTRYTKKFFSPSPAYCTDNGAMIAFVGHYKAQQKHWSDYTLDIPG
ncbi:tRNA (adenosine(37)-N6)-threonylcarbamoyltransferase complex transferase subunit TsaD [Candidatus Dependentiae bacterium]|nr:tRNA (adenosine(37)-N6)-threonylcarbamoyltransferase complex transferase subunit TsaD [Candidatus Dependentiae bacterium]